MINELIGKRVEIGGQVYLETTLGASGHAIYGPYKPLEPGKYVIEYSIKLTEIEYVESDLICANVDVACASGSIILAQSLVYLSQIRDGNPIQLIIDVNERYSDYEFRIYINGTVRLLLADNPMIKPVMGGPKTSSRFFNDNVEIFARFFVQGFQVKIVGPNVVMTASGVSFYVNRHDDLNFIDEIFLKYTYNILLPHPTCLIDVGMNLGFTSLLLATREEIREVHAFEPFKTTFDRASANVALNPNLGTKVRANNFGLSDKDADILVQIDSSDSGSYSVTGSGKGETVPIQIRDAATILQPIIERAKANGLLILMKVDCEGSEFAIFRSLQDRGLLNEISAFMVEWHTGWGSHHQLTDPLRKSGFSIIDLSPRTGNGFFYAVKTAMRHST